jgi:molybdate transport system substrate-binding protein
MYAACEDILWAREEDTALLAEAIMRGEAADVYVSANVTWMRRLQRARIVRHWATRARNRVCLITRPDLSISRVEELSTPGLSVVAPQAQTDPGGRYGELLWRRTGVLGRMRAKQAVGELVRSVGSGDLPGSLFDGRAQVGTGASKEVQGDACP